MELGDFNNLKVVRTASFGVFLDAGTGNTSDDVLLPNGSIVGVPPKIGDEVRVFLYKDSKDRMVATMKEPLVTVGQMGHLKVTGLAEFGAFVDFGLERDILVPKSEMQGPMEVGRAYLVYIYVDKSKRLAATTDVDRILEPAPEGTYKEGDEVEGILYAIQTNGTLEVALEKRYQAIVLHNEYFETYQVGDVVRGAVKRILEDGRVSFTPRKRMVEAKKELSDVILQYLKEHGGSMPFNDKSTPEEIRRTFKTSKNYFKIALGNLMKQGRITQDGSGTHLTKK